MTDHFDWDRLARYVSGEAGATERADIEKWAAATESNRAMLESLRRRWNAAGDGAEWNVDAAWSRLAPRLREVTVEPVVVDIASRRAQKTSWFSAGRLIPLAAAAALVLAVAFRFATVDRAPAGGTMAMSPT